MNDAERVLLHNALIEANRALLNVASIDHLGGRKSLDDEAIRDSLVGYENLLHCQATLPLSPEESANVQGVLDRLKAHLKFFGQNV